MFTNAIISSSLLWSAEVLASFFIWRGAPTDWTGQPPRFWSFELWRLQYWGLFFSLSASLWVIAWFRLRRRSGKIGLALLGAILAVAVEVLTSILYWKQLLPVQASYLGWSSFQRYLGEHLISWIVVLLICLGVKHLWNRKRLAQHAVRVMA
jgi:hypothetical protein